MTTDLATWVRTHAPAHFTEAAADNDDGLPLTVVRVSSAGPAPILGRLGDLGLGPGEVIHYFGCAPLGEPLFICVRDTVVALRLGEAKLIEVESV